MKPTLTIQDPAGVHCSDLEGTNARLMRGASWKVQRIISLIPAGESMPAQAALSHWNLMFPPNQAVVRMLAQGMEVGDAYTNAIENILAHPDLGKWEYLLTVEADNLPPADGVLKLLEQMEAHPEYSCIGGLYFTKGAGGCAQIWGDPKDPVLNFRPLMPIDGELVECCGTGMGFNLWRLQMFRDERLRKPWFKTVASLEEGVGTQDLWFWNDARKHGYRCAIDCSVKVGHLDMEGKCGPAGTVW
jgi:hypothetical protein